LETNISPDCTCLAERKYGGSLAGDESVARILSADSGASAALRVIVSAREIILA
jgi:hypothetical protein